MNDHQFYQLCENNNIDIQSEKTKYQKKLNLSQKLQYKLDKHDSYIDRNNDMEIEVLTLSYEERINNKNDKFKFYRNLNINIGYQIKLYNLLHK